MMGGANAHYEGIKAFSETDFTDDLRMIDVPTLLMHGDDDQVVPIANSAQLAITLLKHGTLKVYPGLSHGMCTVNAEVINRDLLEFVRASDRHRAAFRGADDRPPGADPVDPAPGGVPAATIAAQRVAEVRDRPQGRMELLRSSYAPTAGAAPLHRPYPRAALAFMGWQLRR